MAVKKNQTTPKYKLTLSVDHDFARRFGAYSSFLGEDMSDVAVRALRKEMRGFSISRRIEADDQGDGQAESTVRLARPAESREAG